MLINLEDKCPEDYLREQEEAEEGLSEIDRARIECALNRPLKRVDYMIDPRKDGEER
jgi:hypothetical protein